MVSLLHPRVTPLVTSGPIEAGIILRCLPEPVVTITALGTITTLNPAAEALLEICSRQAAGQPWTDLFQFAEDGSPGLVAPVLSGYSKHEVGTRRIKLIKRKREILVLVSIASLADQADGEGAVLILRDITALEQARQDFVHSRHLASLQQLAGGLATHCNNLVAAMQGSLEPLLKSVSQGDRELRNFQNMQKSVAAAATVTRQLMAFSKRVPMDTRLLDLNSTIQLTLPLLKSEASPGTHLVFEPARSLGRIEMDPSHAEEVLLTLLRSASEAMPGGGIIRIATSNFEIGLEAALRFVDVPAGEYVRLEISNTGGGCDPQAVDSVFEPFFPLSSPGRGVGLASVYGLVKQAGGHIWQESAGQDGTCFVMCWPRAESGPDAEGRWSGLGGDESVLVVERDPATRDIMQRALLSNGYHMIEATGPSQALRSCRQWKGSIDLVLINVLMPSMTGLELVRRVRALRPDTKVLLMSSYHSRVLEEAGVELGYRFIQKPFSAYALARKVREILNS